LDAFNRLRVHRALRASFLSALIAQALANGSSDLT